jgi:ubiquinone/menaquinone biosynthesis C-methylase UbiE
MNKKTETSWESVSKWYDDYQAKDGGYFHNEIIMPKLLPLLNLKAGDSLLDVACGEGILSRKIPKGIKYLGLDASKSLIQIAKQKNSAAEFIVQDATKPFSINETFSHATIILAFQNIEKPDLMLKEIAKVLKGKLVITLNHPCFRIPRQSSWGYDESKKLQYRRIDRYMTHLDIPIQMSPSQKEASSQTISFHTPLSTIFSHLNQAGFVVENLHEWCSEKESIGSRAKAENRAREEFPLFLTLVCNKGVNF